MAGNLARPTLDNFDIENLSTGDMEVDIDWVGQENHIDLHQVRYRWIRRTDGTASPPPAQATAEGWAESSTLATVGMFQYIDRTVLTDTAHEAVTGAVDYDDVEIAADGNGNSSFANAVVWCMARLEVA